MNKETGRMHTRWSEAKERLKQMIEVLAYVPFNQIGIEFLNRSDRINLTRQGRDPASFIAHAYQQVDSVFDAGPRGTTPALEKLQQSFSRGQGMSIARYLFCDGVPNVSRLKAYEKVQFSTCMLTVLSFFSGRCRGTKGNHGAVEESTRAVAQSNDVSELHQRGRPSRMDERCRRGGSILLGIGRFCG